MKRLFKKHPVLFSCLLPALVLPLLWFGILTSGPSRQFGLIVNSLHSLTHGENVSVSHVVSASVLIESAEGIPKELVGQSVDLNFRAPDRLLISAEIDEHSYHIGRNGESIWVSIPHDKFAIEGRNDVPRFANDKNSFQQVELPDFRSSLKYWQLLLLPALVKVTESDEGVLVCKPRAFLAKKFDIPFDTRLKLKLNSRGRLSYVDVAREGFHVNLKIENFEVNPSLNSELSWELPEIPGVKTERVALSHLERFVEVVLTNLDNELETLPPLNGDRRVVATHAKGRLEIHDGTRVLFMNGTPEEMGEQHGNLLKSEITDLVNRIVYGVGVGSSFGKGRWFFGEIEEAIARLEPFIDKRHIGEMDSIAAATGLHPQEIRLANFFPELFHCTGFSLHGKATASGRMYHGRVLDYLRGLGLEQNAVVMVVQPDEGNAWVNVGYAGFIGSVTAMNEKHLAIGEMGGRGEGNWDGKPMAQLMREVMEKADTIDEAVDLMKNTPRTCEYYYVISDAKTMRAVGIKATPEIFETIWSGESHPQLTDPVEDTVLMSAGDRYTILVERVKSSFGKFDPESARELMTRPVCMKSNIQSVLFAPDTLDFWVANADSDNIASATRYTKYNLAELLETADKNQISAPALTYTKEAEKR